MKGIDLIELVNTGERSTFESFLDEPNFTPITFDISSYSMNAYRVPREIHDLIEEARGNSFAYFPENRIEHLIAELKKAYKLKDVYFIYNWEEEPEEYTIADILDKIMIMDLDMNLRQFSESLLSTGDQTEFKDIK